MTYTKFRHVLTYSATNNLYLWKRNLNTTDGFENLI